VATGSKGQYDLACANLKTCDEILVKLNQAAIAEVRVYASILGQVQGVYDKYANKVNTRPDPKPLPAVPNHGLAKDKASRLVEGVNSVAGELRFIASRLQQMHDLWIEESDQLSMVRSFSRSTTIHTDSRLGH
jgi:hypothetical protein